MRQALRVCWRRVWWRAREECDRLDELVAEVVDPGSVAAAAVLVVPVLVVPVLVVPVLVVAVVVGPEPGAPPAPPSVHAQATPPPKASETTVVTTASVLTITGATSTSNAIVRHILGRVGDFSGSMTASTTALSGTATLDVK